MSFWNKILWIDETKIYLYPRDGKRKVWREKKENDHDPKHTTSLVKHGDIGSLTASETVLLVFIKGEEANSSSKMNSELHRSNLKMYKFKQMLQKISVGGFLPLLEIVLRLDWINAHISHVGILLVS